MLIYRLYYFCTVREEFGPLGLRRFPTVSETEAQLFGLLGLKF